MDPEKTKKWPYLKWPWDLVVYAGLLLLLRVLAVPLILLLIGWNKKHRPNRDYCLRRTRDQLVRLVWAAAALLLAAAGGAYLTLAWTGDRAGWDLMEYGKLAAAGLLAVGGILVAGYEAYTGLRDAFCPGKSRLARSIRTQLPYPEEAPPVDELFAMVDEDIRKNGRWFGRLAVGSQWVLGEQAMYLPRVRAVFWQDAVRSRRSGRQVTTVRILQLYLLDDRRQQQCAELRTPAQLQAALDWLRQVAPAAVFAPWDSRECRALTEADEQQWQAAEQAFAGRKARLEYRAVDCRSAEQGQ